MRRACKKSRKTSRVNQSEATKIAQDWDSVKQQVSLQNPGAHGQQKLKSTRDQQRPRKPKEAKNFSKSEAELVDVMDTLQHAISIIEKEIAKNPAFLQKEIDTRNTDNAMVTLIVRKTLNVNSLQQKVSTMRRTTEQINDQFREKLGTLTTIEDAHNNADYGRRIVTSRRSQ